MHACSNGEVVLSEACVLAALSITFGLNAKEAITMYYDGDEVV